MWYFLCMPAPVTLQVMGNFYLGARARRFKAKYFALTAVAYAVFVVFYMVACWAVFAALSSSGDQTD